MVLRHGHGCAYGARRPSGLGRPGIEAIEGTTSDTAGSPPPAQAQEVRVKRDEV